MKDNQSHHLEVATVIHEKIERERREETLSDLAGAYVEGARNIKQLRSRIDALNDSEARRQIDEISIMLQRWARVACKHSGVPSVDFWQAVGERLVPEVHSDVPRFQHQRDPETQS